MQRRSFRLEYDSDSEEEIRVKRKSISSNKKRVDSSDSESEKIVSKLKAGNFKDKLQDSIYLKKQDESSPKNIRVVSRSRNSFLSNNSNNAVKPVDFIPREVKSKSFTKSKSSFTNNDLIDAEDIDNDEIDLAKVPVSRKAQYDTEDSFQVLSHAPKKFLEPVVDENIENQPIQSKKSFVKGQSNYSDQKMNNNTRSLAFEDNNDKQMTESAKIRGKALQKLNSKETNTGFENSDFEEEDGSVQTLDDEPQFNVKGVRNEEDFDEFNLQDNNNFATYNNQKEVPRKSGRYDNASDLTSSPDHSSNSSNMMNSSPDLVGNVSIYQSTQIDSNSFSSSAKHSFVLLAPPRQQNRTSMVQCTILRNRQTIAGTMYPTYELILEHPKKTLIIAQKMTMNRTSNYHLFDMTRGQAGSKLSKKNGNYLGKLRARNSSRNGYSIVSHKLDREEVGAVLFEHVSIFNQLKDGNQPRKLHALFPKPNEENFSPTVNTMTYGVESLLDLIKVIETGGKKVPNELVMYQTKAPFFENGNYRLNFHGRVSMPSVKNFQIVKVDDNDDVICQFGKVDNDAFHLDYKAPMNAFQAFSLALCQFNL